MSACQQRVGGEDKLCALFRQLHAEYNCCHGCMNYNGCEYNKTSGEYMHLQIYKSV